MRSFTRAAFCRDNDTHSAISGISDKSFGPESKGVLRRAFLVGLDHGHQLPRSDERIVRLGEDLPGKMAQLIARAIIHLLICPPSIENQRPRLS